MRTKLLCTAFFAAALSLTALAAPMTEGAEPGVWTMDMPAAQTLAKEKSLPILINFTGSDWCGWCKLMDKKVFSQQAWQDYAKKNVVTVWVDSPRDESLVPEALRPKAEALRETYDIQGFPTYVVLNAEGKELGRLGASQDATPESFIAELQGVLIRDRLPELLSAEELAEFEQIGEAKEALEKRHEALMKDIETKMTALQEEYMKLDSREQELLKKATEKANKSN